MKIKNIGYNLKKIIQFNETDPHFKRYFFYWLGSLFFRRYFKKYPWVTFGAINWLEINLKKDWNILEFGSGSSTIYFSKKANFIHSFEHNDQWRFRVLKLCDKYNLSQIEIYSYSEMDKVLNFVPERKFDLIVIDGIDRVETFKKSFNFVKNGGFILLDNSERGEYYFIHETLNKYSFVEFEGVSPYNMKLSKTKIWKIE